MSANHTNAVTQDRIEIVAQTISGGRRVGPMQADYNFATEIIRVLDAYDRARLNGVTK